MQVVSNMPFKDSENRPTLLIDESFKDIDLEQISQLQCLAKGKLYLKITDEYQSYLESNKELVQRYKYP